MREDGAQVVLVPACTLTSGLNQALHDGDKYVIDEHEVTTRLMYDFYEGLRSGLTKGTALREALLRAKESKPHPYYWAPFILMGKST